MVRTHEKPRRIRSLRSDGEATRARILEAAGELFAAHGFAETTSKAVAAKAGVDLASINYHFGSRNQLYQAVLLEAHNRLIDPGELQRLAGAALAPAEQLRRLIELLVGEAKRETAGWPLGVLAAEVSAPSSHVEVLMEQGVFAKIAVVRGIIARIVGKPAGDPAVLRCTFSIIAPCLLLLIGRRGLPGPVREILKMQAAVLVDHLHRFAMAGLQAIGHSHPGGDMATGTGKSGKPAGPAAANTAGTKPADWRERTLARMRELILAAAPGVVEERKWIKPSNPAGVPVWSLGGIVCTGETYKHYVKLTFAKGARLPDPAQLFNASLEGNARRAIDIREGETVDARAFKALVKAAVALNGTPGKTYT
ncbi:MAG: CerR family C-terminal domain-containing protein [Pseudoxanthomonas sp.]